MARDTAAHRRSTESRLIFTILGVTVWVATGFIVGLVAGVVSEEPQMLAVHLTGQDTEIEWVAESDTSNASAASAASVEGLDVAAAPLARPPLTRPASLDDGAGLSDPRFRPSLEPRDEVKPLSARPERSPTPAAPAPELKGPGYLIQVGAYSSRGAAQEVAETLRGKGYAVEVLSAADDGRFRVRVGPVAARDRAEGLAKRLEDDEGLPTWILRARES